jgi:hypothetical protein
MSQYIQSFELLIYKNPTHSISLNAARAEYAHFLTKEGGQLPFEGQRVSF